MKRAQQHLVQILLPLSDNAGASLPAQSFTDVREVLIQKFGGLTAYRRAPAEGLWEDEQCASPSRQRDEIVVYEVMVAQLDEAWWAEYRHVLERAFRQKDLVIRAHAIQML